MLAALFIAVTSSAQSKPTLICEVKGKLIYSHIGCTVLTDQQTVAGYICDMVGHHGETFWSKPFVWVKGKLTMLPIAPKEEHGLVLDGDDNKLVGSVTINYRERPAMWTPDPKLGWAKPTLKILSTKHGEASHIGNGGTIWVQNENKIVARITKGKWEDMSLGSFHLQGFDEKGRMYGNQFKGIHFGGSPADTTPSILDKGVFAKLPLPPKNVDYRVDSYLTDVNSQGIAVGTAENQAVIWRNGKVELLLGNKERWSRATKINDLGDVVGYCSVADVDSSRSFLWQNGKVIDLASFAPGIKIDAPLNLNNHGVVGVIVREKANTKLYLIRT